MPRDVELQIAFWFPEVNRSIGGQSKWFEIVGYRTQVINGTMYHFELINENKEEFEAQMVGHGSKDLQYSGASKKFKYVEPTKPVIFGGVSPPIEIDK